MDPKYNDMKIIDLSEEELTTLGFLGPNALQGVKDMVQSVKKSPKYLGNITCFQIERLRLTYTPKTPAQGDPGIALSFNRILPTMKMAKILEGLEPDSVTHRRNSVTPAGKWSAMIAGGLLICRQGERRVDTDEASVLVVV